MQGRCRQVASSIHRIVTGAGGVRSVDDGVASWRLPAIVTSGPYKDVVIGFSKRDRWGRKPGTVEYTILRPTVYMDVWIGSVVGVPLMARQSVSLIGRGDHRHNFVSEVDVAAFCVAAADNPRVANQRLDIGGPASYTWTEIVDAVGGALGAPLPVSYLPPGSGVPLLPAEVGTLLSGLETFETFLDMGGTARSYGIRLTPLDDFIRRTFAR